MDASSFISKTVSQRTKLLAMRYAGLANAELDARLEILNARTGRLVPRVDEQDWAALEDARRLFSDASVEIQKLIASLD